MLTKNAVFRVWCKNKNEWERDLIAILPSGGLLHHTGYGKYIPCNPDTHEVVYCTGLYDESGVGIYRGDYLKVTLPEALSRVSMDDECLVPKTVIGEVRINPKSGARLLVRKVSGCANDGIAVGGYLRIRKSDKVIGNVFEHPELPDLLEKNQEKTNKMHFRVKGERK